ncbi:MAG: DUF2442 domain-containing protein [Bacteroidales bacterium]
MNWIVKNVQALENYKLLLTFANGERREFNMAPYLNKGVFKVLQDVRIFNTVRVSFDSIEWENGADFDPEFLYKESALVK